MADCLAAASLQLAATLGLDKREARLEARVLAAHAWQVDRAWLVAHDTDRPSAVQISAFDTLLTRRLTSEPVAYLTGTREFYGRPFQVTSDVLIPRPETELLVEAALERLPKDRPTRILDLGTGSGCIAITLGLERPDCTIWAVDKSEAALAVARMNAQKLGATQLQFVHSDWFDALKDQRFTLILANPPYICADDPMNMNDPRFEPTSALIASGSGLDDLSAIITTSPAHLEPRGWLIVEHGWNQRESCQSIFHRSHYVKVQTLNDLANLPRITLGQRNS
ncbi:MAG: peptide chain release factor N(5)-glutamine methyltransferase [Thiobacillus sp.]